jgi:hypothetical protein
MVLKMGNAAIMNSTTTMYGAGSAPDSGIGWEVGGIVGSEQCSRRRERSLRRVQRRVDTSTPERCNSYRKGHRTVLV